MEITAKPEIEIIGNGIMEAKGSIAYYHYAKIALRMLLGHFYVSSCVYDFACT